MNKPAITFGQLRQFMSDLGFQVDVVPKEYVYFRHDEFDITIIIPIYRTNQIMAERHLLEFRMQLDAKGIMDADDFDRFAESGAVRHPA